MSTSAASTSAGGPRIAVIGIMPDTSSLSAEQQATAKARLSGAMQQLSSAGYHVTPCFLKAGDTQPLSASLPSGGIDGVVVASALRLQAAHSELFERVVNELHSRAPQARFVFPDSPELVLQALSRQFPQQQKPDAL